MKDPRGWLILFILLSKLSFCNKFTLMVFLYVVLVSVTLIFLIVFMHAIIYTYNSCFTLFSFYLKVDHQV